ncbi:hypothetical protein EON80_15845 [bacterium]|nr:MAG: hypothetical protein EON80_15845 [bacterium]
MKLLALVLCCALVGPARADADGYQQLLAAARLIIPGKNGGPIKTKARIDPEENLRLERLAVARNTPALFKVRQALKTGITLSEGWDKLGYKSSDSLFRAEDGFRDLAWQLRQQSDVCVADGDLSGALDARFTLLQFANIFLSDGAAHGPLVSHYIHELAVGGFEAIAIKLDAQPCRAAIARLQTERIRRPEYAQHTRASKEEHLKWLREVVGPKPVGPEWKQELFDSGRRWGMGLRDEQIEEIVKNGSAPVIERTAHNFDLLIARDEMSYSTARQVDLPQLDETSISTPREDLLKQDLRFQHEVDTTELLLLEGALELRAIRLETGKYSPEFLAPQDPFASGKHLIYRPKNDGYLLYSIGPDGVDDEGAAIQSILRNPYIRITDRDGHKIEIYDRTNFLLPKSTGDILAPVL